MTNTLVGVWLILFGVLGLVSTKIPEFIVPLAAVIVGLIIIAGGFWKRTP